VAGFEKVKAALRAGEVGLLIQAADAAEDGRHKIRALARAVAPKTPVVQFCGAAELGAAVGREAAVHVGIAPGRFAEGLAREIQRLADLRGVAEQGNEVGRPTEGER
jgi:ribosomal protein L7Ae-like RNA K-turn-binding protein